MKTQPQHDWKEGDILVSTWGYNQTNVDFYRVEEVRGKQKVILSHLENKTVADHEITIEVVPCLESPVSDEKIVKMVLTRDSRHYVKIRNFMTAVKWSGKPVQETGWCYGH